MGVIGMKLPPSGSIARSASGWRAALAGLLLVALLPLPTAEAQQAEDLRVFHRSPTEPYIAYADAPNALYRYLAEQAFSHLDRRERELEALRTPEDWRHRQQQVRETLLQVVGAFPERTPLPPQITGRFERDGAIVETIVFESVPGYHVTAALFRPAGVSEPRPGIVYFSGHALPAFRSDAYQQVILNLVDKGFVVLAIDPVGQGERLEYIDPVSGDTLVRGNTGHHSYSGAQLFLSGHSQAGLMTWDGVRAIDYLVSRPEVDPARIGVTGRSGGGTQAAYVAALDDRVLAAAPENYITSFRRLWETRGPQDAEQNFYHGIARGLDHGDLLLARAPRPTLLIATTRDIFSIQGTRETYAAMHPAFAALGGSEALQLVEDDAGHESTLRNREALYRFFQDALNLPGDPRDQKITPIPVDSLRVSPTGLVTTSFEGETTFTRARDAARENTVYLQAARGSGAGHIQRAVHRARQLSGYEAPTTRADPIFMGRYPRDGYSVEKYLLPVEAGYPLPYLVMVPDGDDPHPAILYLHPDGKDTNAGVGGEMERLVRAGYLVAAMDLVGTGELGPGLYRGDSYDVTVGEAPYGLWFGAVLVGKSFVGLQAADIVRLLRAVRARPDVSTAPVRAIAVTTAASALQHAAAFEPEIDGIALIEPLVSFGSVASTQYYRPEFITGAVAGMLTGYDLPDLMAAIAPRPALVINPVDAAGEGMSVAEVTAEWSLPGDLWSESAQGGQFQLRTAIPEPGEETLRWLADLDQGN